jgi:P-type Cu+ transporter
MAKAKIKIEGMHCASCAANIEKALSKVRGVGETRVNAIIGKAIVEVEDNVSEDQLKRAVKDAGFTPTNIEIN